MRVSQATIVALAILVARAASADLFLTEGTNISVDVAADGRLATDLLGAVWVLPGDGGEAVAVASGDGTAHRPRWSPDGGQLVFQSSSSDGPSIRLYSFDDHSVRELSDGSAADQQPDWHPDGDRIVFSSARDADDFDLWELDVPTGLRWRLTRLPGSETDPAWSADGRSLVYVNENDGLWSIVLRRRGRQDETLVASQRRLAAPAWRPDGSLVTYLELAEQGWQVSMTILSTPRLHRPLIEGEDFFLAPLSWAGRQQMLYTANGKIRRRAFNSWSSDNVPFRARVGSVDALRASNAPPRELPIVDAGERRTVIRASRLFDGIGGGYRRNADIVIDAGRITSVTSGGAHDDAIVIDLGNVTVLPGYIDAYARLPENPDPALGPALLSLGLTTVVADLASAQQLTEAWSGKDLPGPRVLRYGAIDAFSATDSLPWLVTVSGDRATGAVQRELVRSWQARGVAVAAEGWQAALGSGANLLVGTDSRPTSPGGRRYQDVQLASGTGAVAFLSGLADARTPGIEDLRAARATPLIAGTVNLNRRFSATPNLAAAANTMVLGSRPNGLPAGLGLHAELRALVAAGLTEEQALKAAGVNAATVLGLGLRVGRIAPGAVADLVVVDGDPLNRISDTLKIVGIVRNGRFYSVSGLLERSRRGKTVE